MIRLLCQCLLNLLAYIQFCGLIDAFSITLLRLLSMRTRLEISDPPQTATLWYLHDYLPCTHLVQRHLLAALLHLAIIGLDIGQWIHLQINKFIKQSLPELKLILIRILQTWPQYRLAVCFHFFAVRLLVQMAHQCLSRVFHFGIFVHAFWL